MSKINKLPDSWSMVKLDKLHIGSRESVKPFEFPDEEFEHYSIPAFQENNKQPFIHRGESIKSNKLLVDNNDVLFGKLNPRKPKVWLVDSDSSLRKISSTEFLPITVEQNIVDSRYIYQSLTSDNFKELMMSMAAGSTNSHQRASPQSFYNSKIPLPPLPEQQKIAEILSTVDDKIDVMDQQIAETQELKKGLMQRLLIKGIGHTEFKDSPLGKIPKSWKVVKIQDLLDTGKIISHLDGNHGGLYPKADEFINEGVPYIGANCFINSRVDFSKCKHLSMERSLQFRKGVAKNGDVLFAHNATVGPVAFLETDLDFVILSTTATYFRLDNKTIDAKYWLFFLSSPTFKNQYEKVMGQSTRNQVPITMQRSFLSVLPLYEEQREISEILNTVDSKLEVLLGKKSNYQELKQGLMQQLLTGKIRVKN